MTNTSYVRHHSWSTRIEGMFSFFRVIQGLMGYRIAVPITLYRGVHVEVSSFLSFLKVSYNHVIVIDACIILRTCIVLVTCIWAIHPCILFIKILSIYTAQVCPV